MFISFEGIEGSGKSTVLNRLCALLDSRALGVHPAYVRSREPGGSALGATLRALLLDARASIAPEAELFLYLADRAQHVSEVIRPALDAGRLVLCDRYADSTIVYQGFGRGLDVERLYALNESATLGLWPEITLLYDLDPEVGLSRARTRNDETGLSLDEGRFEAEAMAFHQRVRQGYREWASRFPARFHIIDASCGAEDVFAATLEALSPVLAPFSK